MNVENFRSVYRNNPVYIKYYMNFAGTFLHGIIPFVALLVFNVRIYHRYVRRQYNDDVVYLITPARFLLTRGRYSRNNNNSSQVSESLSSPT